MNNDLRGRTDDPFLLNYNATDLRIASEFLSNWLPFLSRDLCHHCSQNLSDRIRSLDPEVDGDAEPIKQEENLTVLAPNIMKSTEFNENHDNCDTNSLGSWKDAADMNDTADTNSLESGKNGESGWSEPVTEASTSETVGSLVVPVESPMVRMSWADMAQEDELEEEEEKEEEEENEVNRPSVDGHAKSGEATKVRQKPELSREQREYIRFSNVERKKDFIGLERVKGKIVNILDGLELHTGVFSAAEQKRIVDFVYMLQERGKKGELKGQSIQPAASTLNSVIIQ